VAFSGPTFRRPRLDVQWSSVDGNRIEERLALDHAELLQAALSRLRNKVEYTSLPAFLMPAEFTLTQLQRVYEIVLGRTLEKKAFRTSPCAQSCEDERYDGVESAR
jgi:8-oxo-dGTP diphosphatase